MSNNRNGAGSLSSAQLAEVFKALSNPHRLEIFMRLACCPDELHGPQADGQVCACVGSLGEGLGLAPSTVSHHLKALAHAGLIKMNRRGQTTECRVDPDIVKAVAEFFDRPFCIQTIAKEMRS